MPGLVRVIGRNASLLVGVLLAALLVLAIVVRLPPLQRWTAAQVSARLPAGMTIQRATISVLPPGVRLTHVTLADQSVLRSVSCYVRAAALLAGRLELRRISIKGADIAVERTAAGALRFSTAPPQDTAPPGASSRPPAAIPPLGAIPAVTVKDANVTFIDHAVRHDPQVLRWRAVRFTLGNPSADSAPVTLSARLDPAGRLDAHGTLRRAAVNAGAPGDRSVSVTFKATGLDAQTVFGYLAESVPGGGSAKATGTLDATLTLTGRFPGGLVGDATLSSAADSSVVWDDVHLTAPLTLSAQFTAARDAVTISNGQITIAQVGAGRIAAADVGVEFAYAGDALSVTSARASLYGGTWSQRGSIALADPPTFDTTARADNLDCAALLTALTGAPPEYGCERFDANATVRGPWTGARTVTRSAEGSGAVTLRGGTIPAASVIGAIWQAVIPLVHAKKELNDVTSPTHVDHLTQSFTLQDGDLHTSDLNLVADDYTITGTGNVGLDGSLDLRTEIAMTAEGVTKLLTMASLPLPGRTATLPPIPARITGSVDLPVIRPEMADLPTDAIQTLVLDARSAGKTLKDAAGGGLEQLQHGLETLW